MSENVATLIVNGLSLYALLGLTTALIFVLGGVGRIDPTAKTMPIRARLLVAPGIVGLWPLMLVKFVRQKEPPLS